MTVYEHEEFPSGIEGFGELEYLVGESLLKDRMAKLIQVADLTQHELPPDVTPLLGAWNLLARAQEQTQAKGEDYTVTLLQDPATSGWLEYCRNRLFGEAAANDDTSLGMHALYVHALAASAAIAADLEFEIDVAVWDGSVILPTLGRFTLHDPSADQAFHTARLKTDGQQIEIVHGEHHVQLLRQDVGQRTEHWEPLEHVEHPIEGSDVSFDIVLDDSNPYRRPDGPIPPHNDAHRLSREDKDLWLEKITEAVHIFASEYPDISKNIALCIRSIVPLAFTPRARYFRPYSASGGRTIGTAELNWQNDATEMMNSLVHESAHNALFAAMRERPVTDPLYDKIECFYAPWRDDPRHGFGTLHGVWAFSSIAQFFNQHAQRQTEGTPEHYLAVFNWHLWQTQQRRALEQLDMTLLYKDLASKQITKRIGSLAISTNHLKHTAILEDADRAASYHWARWMAHHLHPNKDQAEQLGFAWLGLRGRKRMPDVPLPITSLELEVKHEVSGRHFDVFAQLFRLKNVQPQVLSYMYKNPDSIAELLPGASYADVCLFAGDWHQATSLYMERLRSMTDYDNAQDIVGLGYANMIRPSLIRHGKPSNELGAVLYGHPYLYRAIQRIVMREVGEPEDPMRLTKWLGRLPLHPVIPASLKSMQQKMFLQKNPHFPY